MGPEYNENQCHLDLEFTLNYLIVNIVSTNTVRIHEI